VRSRGGSDARGRPGNQRTREWPEVRSSMFSDGGAGLPMAGAESTIGEA
jgi:hypothetical protein